MMFVTQASNFALQKLNNGHCLCYQTGEFSMEYVLTDLKQTEQLQKNVCFNRLPALIQKNLG